MTWLKHSQDEAAGCKGIRTKFGVGRRGEVRRAESGGGVLGEGAANPSPPAREFVGAL